MENNAESLLRESNASNGTIHHQYHHHLIYIKGYDLALNHENLFSSTILLNESMLFCIEVNSSTSSFKYSVDVLLKSSGFSLYIDVNNEDISSMKGKFKHSLEEKYSSTRVTSPTSSTSREISNIYILAIPHTNNSTSTLESRDLKVSLRVLISEYSLTGGAISFLALLLIVVIGIVILLVIAAISSCIKPKTTITEKSFELDGEHDQNQYHDISSSNLYYTNAAVLDKNV